MVYTSPVYDPGLWVKTLPSVSPFTSLTLLHAVWWSTHPQCMNPAFGLNTPPSVPPFTVSHPFACSVLVYTPPVNDPGLWVKHTLPSVPLFTVSYPFCMQCGGLHIPSVWPQPFGFKHTSVCTSVTDSYPFACSVVVYTSPVYDPGLRDKTHFRLYLCSLSLTLMHAVWWSTHPQGMTPAFGSVFLFLTPVPRHLF